MQQAKRKLMLEHLVVQKMGKSQQMRQEELDDLIRYGAAELFADADIAPKALETAVNGMPLVHAVRKSAFQMAYILADKATSKHGLDKQQISVIGYCQ